MRQPTKRQFRAFTFSHALVLMLCYSLLLQPNAALASRRNATDLPGPTNGSRDHRGSHTLAETPAGQSGLSAVIDKLGDLIGAVLSSPLPPPVPPLGDAAVSRKVPSLSNGRVEGNLRVYTGQSFSFEGGFVVTNETYVVGTPTVTVATNATYHGSVEEGGNPEPSGYTVAINGTSRLVGKIHLRTDALGFPANIPQSVPQPAGTRIVNINTSSDVNNIGNWATLKELHVNLSGETITVPPGNYGAFSVHGNSRLNFSAGTYNFTDGFTFASNASIKVTGKTVINVGSSANISNTGLLLGNNTLSGDVKLNVLGSLLVVTGNSTIKALVRVPNGTAQITGSSIVRGQVIADTLQILSNAAVEGDTASSGPADTSVPTVSITSPANDFSTSAASVTVSGNASDSGSDASGIFQVTVNNVPASYNVSNGAWTIENVSLAPGSNTITARAIDNAGNLATPQSITVIRQSGDTTAPSVEITSPASNFTTPADSITVSGTAADSGPNATGIAQVTVNGVAAAFTNGTWTISNVPLPTVGDNPIVAVATDTAGNVSSPHSINVIRQPPPDITPPILTITSPSDGSSTLAESITVNGGVSDPGQYASGVNQVTVNGIVASLNAQAGTWSVSGVPVAIGPNTITASAVDNAGKTATQVITITRVAPADTEAPTITITSPSNNFTSPDATITVTGTAVDEGPNATGVRQVLVNGQPATYDPATHQWTATGVALNEGPNTIQVVADDNAPSANSRQVSINVTRQTPDTNAPTITITSPVPGDTYDATVSVAGTVVDEGLNATGVQSVTVNGVQAQYNAGTGQWFVPAVALVDGANNIVVTATDRAPTPNQAQANVLVTRLRIPPPTLVISNPQNGSVLAATSITVAGTVSSLGTTPTVTVNGQATTVNGGHFARSVSLVEGANTITVVATDSLAQETQSSLSVIRDLLPPAVTFGNVPASVQPGATYQILVDATDNVGIADVEFSVNGQHVAVATTSPYQFTLAVPLTYAAGADLVLTAVARDLSNTTAVATAETRTGGPGGISGYVFDDTTGFVLQGVRALMNNDSSVLTDQAGTFNLISLAPSGVVRLTKDGHTPVERLYSVSIGEGTALFDARLTPLDPQSNVINISGGVANGDSGRLQVNFPAGTFASATDMRVTGISPQGLANLLPYGWSPVPGAVVDVRPAVANADVSQEFPAPAHLTVSQLSGLTSATPLTLARYDDASHRWMVLGVELHANGGTSEVTLSANLPRPGQYAFLVADTAPTAPPPAVMGQPLTASRSVESAALDSAQASAVATPRTAVFSNSARSAISFFATALSQLPSGVSIEATFDETYNLLGGRDSVLVDRPAQDFVLYAYPAAAGNQPNRLGAFFVAKPTRTDFNLTELFNANVHVEIRSGRQSRLGSLVDNSGGGVRASDGSLLTIPANALSGPQAVFFNDLSPELANVNLPPGYEIVGAFDLDWGSATLNASATISVPGINGDLSRIVVARLLTVGGQRSPKIVGRAIGDAAGNVNSTTATPPVPAGVVLSGIRTSGRYVFIRVPAPFGYVKGPVIDAASSNPLSMVKVSGDQTPFIDVTGADGQYVVVGSAGSGAAGLNQIGAVALTTDATGRVAASLNAQDAVAIANISVGAAPLQVESVTPASNAQNMIATTPVTITFNKPIAASSLTGSSFTLSTVSGNPVLGNITVLAGSRVVVFTPAATLAASTNYKVTITQSVRDIYGHPLAANFVSTFTTAAAVAISNRLRPEQISISYPDAGGVSSISIPAGSVAAGATILVVNMTNGSTVTTVAGSAAITLSVPANVGDEIVLTIRQADGTEYTVTQSAYRRADGFVSVGANGGAVTSDDGTIVLQIPSGAINGQANIKLTPKGEDSITLARTGEMDPSNVAFGAGVEITSSGDFTLLKEVHLELAAPAGAPEGKRMAFMKPSKVQIDGQDTDVWETVTSGTVIGGKFKTSSPPFFGSFFAVGVFSVYAMMPTFGRVIFGKVTDGTANGPGVPGVICMVGDFNTGYFGRVTGRSRSDGTYALFEFSASTQNAVPVKALDVATGRTALGTATTAGTIEEDFFQGLSGFQSLRGNIILPPPGSTGGGEPPPSITVFGRINSPVPVPLEQDPLYSRGVVTVPQGVTIVAVSNRPLPQITGTALVGGVETRQLTWQEIGANTYAAQLVVSAEGSYFIRVTGSTQPSNPTSSSTATYNFVGLQNPNTRPPLPEPPSVIHVTPNDNAENVDLATDIRLEFSEPVRNLVPGSTVYVQEVGQPERIGGTILSGGSIVQPDTPSISSIVFKPASSLRAGKKHFIHVTTDVRDDTGDALDQQYEGQNETNKQPFSSSFVTFAGLVVTPQPVAEIGTRVVIAGNYALTMQSDQSNRSRINIYDIANPISPTRTSSFFVPQRAFDLTAADSEEDSLKIDGRVHTHLAAVVTVAPLHQEQWANVWFVNFDEVSTPEIVGVTSLFLPLDVPSTPLSVRLHKGRAYIGNIPYQGVNVVDVAQSIRLFNEALAAGKNPVVDAVRAETGSQNAGFGHLAKVQTETLRRSPVLDASGTAPSIAVLNQGVPVVYVANVTPKRLGVMAFPPEFDGINLSTQPTNGVPEQRILSALPVNPIDSDPRFVRAMPDVTLASGQHVPLALLLSSTRLWIFNVTDPRHPVQYPSKSLAEIGLTGMARWFEVEGTLAYVAIDNDVAVIDFADPTNPRLVSRLTGVGSHLAGLAVKDDFIYSISPGFDAQDGLNVSIARPASRVFIFGASADASTVCGNPVIIDRVTRRMKQNAGIYFQVFGHKPPTAQQVVIRKGEQIIATVPATILAGSTELVTLGRAEWHTDAEIDRAATYTAELSLDENTASQYRSPREVIPFGFLLENYNESITLPIKTSTAHDDEKLNFAYVLGANANVTLTVNGTMVLTGPRSFGLHVERLSFNGMSEGRYPFTLSAQAQGDQSISEQVGGVLTIQRDVENARPPGHTVVNGIDIATGNVGISQSDVSEIANRGLSLSFTRSYNSVAANSFGPLGYGWRHNFQILLTFRRAPSGGEVTYELKGGDGSGQSFKATGTSGSLTMNAEKPSHGTLVRKSDGSFDYFTKTRNRYHFRGAYEVNSFNFYDQSYMGNLEFIEEPNGNRLTLVHDSLGRMTSVTDSSNRALAFEYEPAPNPFAGVVATTNGTRSEQSCVPRGQFNLLRQRFIKAQAGQAWRIKSVGGPGGLSVLYGYDTDGNLTQVTRKGTDGISAATADAVWQYAYRPAGGQTSTDLTHFIKSVINPNGHTTNYDYWFAQLGTPAKTVAQPENVTVNFSYTLDGSNRIRQANVTDGRGNATVYTLSADGYTTAMAAPRGAQSTFEFDDAGLKTRETDPLNATTTFEYDAKGNLRKQTTTGGDGATVTFETLYDQTFSKPVSIRDGNGNVTTFTLDGRGKVTQVRKANGNTNRFDYASNGDLLRITDERGLQKQIQYDAYGNGTHIQQQTQSGQTVVTDRSFDARSRLLSTTDTVRPSIARSYDALDRLKTETVTDPASFRESQSSVYTYTPMGQATTATMTGGGQSRTQTFEYDDLERLTRLAENVSGVSGALTRTFTYDRNSNLLTTTDRRGVVTTYEYDALNYRTSARLSGPFGADINVETVIPDLVGNPLSSVDQYGATTAFTHDGLHRLIKRTLPGDFTEEQAFDPNGNIVLTRDRKGRTTTISYDSLNRPAQRRDPAGRVQTWTYTDSTGTVVTNWSPQNVTVTEQVDALGRALRRVTAFGSAQYTTAFSYAGRTRTTVDPRGVSTTEQLSAFGEVGTHEIQTGNQTLRTQMHYAAFGGLSTMTDANNRTTNFVLDGLSRRTSANYPGGFTETWVYDGEGLVLSQTNKRGVTSSMTYDNQGRELTASAQGLGENIPVRSISYDDANRRETRTDANNHASIYTYDGLRRLVSLTNADNRSRTFEYDGINLIKESSFKGQFTDYVYDALNRQTQIKDRLNQVTVIAHNDQNGYAKTVTDRRGNSRVEVYDPLERLTRVTDAGEALVAYEYDGNNNRTAMIDGRLNRTVYTYDELNRVKTINHALVQTETFAYDGVGNVTTHNDGRGADVRMEYDELNHLKKQTDGEDNVTQFRYDGEGLLLEKTDPKGVAYKTTYDYNVLRSLKQVTDARGGVFRFTYDGVQNLKSVKDALDRTVNYDYDELNRLQRVTQPQNLITTFGYDANSNRNSVTDPKGQVTTIAYDELDRPSNLSYANTSGAGPLGFALRYDPESNLTSVTEQLTSTTTRNYARSYDARNRVRTTTDPFNHAVTFAYDAANNLRSVTDAAQKETTYTYDALNRLQNVAMTGGAAAGYSWFADGLLQRVDHGAGLKREYSYDNADRLTQVTNTVGTDSGTQTQQFLYGYDANSNRASETRKLNGETIRSITYGYDLLDRLTAASYNSPGQRPSNPPAGQSVSYMEGLRSTAFGYDAGGNRTSSSVQDDTATITLTTDSNGLTTESRQTANGQPVNTTAQFDQLNRLTELTRSGDSAGPVTYSYDRNGNLISTTQNNQVTSSYEYDCRDQLRRVLNSSNQEIAAYDYDFERRRLSKTVGGSELRYVYGDNQVINEYNAANQLVNRYDLGADEVVRAELGGEGARRYFSDGLGSITALAQQTLTTSSLTASYEYDAWGNYFTAAGASYNAIGYTGQRLDAESGLMPMGQGERYYSPGLGSFIQQDSFTGSGMLAQSLNRYAYAYNNPLRFTDPTGNQAKEEKYRKDGYIQSGLNDLKDLGSSYSTGSWWQDVIFNYTVRNVETSYQLLDSILGGYIHRQDRLLRNYNEGRVSQTKLMVGSFANAQAIGPLAAPEILGWVFAPEVKGPQLGVMAARAGTIGGGTAATNVLGLAFEDTFNHFLYEEEFHSASDYAKTAVFGFMAGAVFAGLDMAVGALSRKGAGTAERVIENTTKAETRTAPLTAESKSGRAPREIAAGEGATPNRIGPERQLPAAGETTLTREQVANYRGTGRERGAAHEQHLTEWTGGTPQARVETSQGLRIHDAHVPTGTKTEMAMEGKNYLRWRTVDGAKVRGEVPLSSEIRSQITKDVLWIRTGRRQGKHRVVQWDFPGAPPRQDLKELLEAMGLPYVH